MKSSEWSTRPASGLSAGSGRRLGFRVVGYVQRVARRDALMEKRVAD